MSDRLRIIAMSLFGLTISLILVALTIETVAGLYG